MEAATEKKRGRPAKHAIIYAAFPEKEKRATANMMYAFRFAKDAMGETPETPNNFFVTHKGNIKRQGIAEQIGRMMDAGLITTEEAKDLGNLVIADYNNGYSVKEIEARLRAIRKTLSKGGKAWKS